MLARELARDILANITNGTPVEYDHILIKGDLDLGGLPTKPIDRNSDEINLLRLSENVKSVSSPIRITHSTIEGTVDFNNTIFQESLDFNNSSIRSVDFRGSIFKRSLDFSNTNFNKVDFIGSKFEEPISFIGANFNGPASFEGSIFANSTNFMNSRFDGTADFGGSKFNEPVVFEGSNFNESADFTESRLKSADFVRSKFNGPASFRRSIFINSANFMASDFRGPVDFVSSNFTENANFLRSNFNESADFTESRFIKSADFVRSEFTGPAVFVGSNFSGSASFKRSTFIKSADFRGSSFNGPAVFDLSIFKGRVDFGDIHITKLDLTTANIDDFYINWEMVRSKLKLKDQNKIRIYQSLRGAYEQLGLKDDANDCYYEIMKVKGSLVDDWSIIFLDYSSRYLYGYGVKPLYPLAWSFSLMTLFGLIFWIKGIKSPVYFSYNVFLSGTGKLLVDTPKLPEDSKPLVRFLFDLERFLGLLFFSLFLITLTQSVIK